MTPRAASVGIYAPLFALLVAAVPTCSRASRQAPAGQVGTVTTPDTKNELVPGTNLSDTATEVGSALDGTATTATIQDAANKLMDADSIAVDAAPTIDLVCEAQLPEPGQPCTTVGVSACTNAGAKEDSYMPICRRPNRVVCGGATSAPTWQLQACSTKFEPCAWAGRVCAESFGAGTCVPYLTHPNVGSWSESVVCPGLVGQTMCFGVVAAACAPLTTSGPLQAKISAALESCAEVTPNDVPYFYPLELCGQLIHCDWKGPIDPPMSQVTEFPTTCILDPITQKARCQKDCHEVGAPGY